jgi:Ca2+-transporting ATPase
MAGENNGSPPFHALPVEEAVRRLRAELSAGLSAAEAARRLEEVGPNALPQPPRRTPLALFLHQFASPLIYLLIGAAVLAFLLGERGDAAVIVSVLLLNAVLGAVQEGRAERSLHALRRLSELQARVVRDGRETTVPAREVAPGELLQLAAGDAVPADARVVEAVALQVAEAALTGESTPVEKRVDPVPEETALTDRSSLVFAGTHVTAGRGRAVVIATGLRTEVGRIASLSEGAAPPSTPLERRIARMGRFLALAALVVFGAVLAAGALRGLPFTDLFMVALSQVVSLVPEGLPVVVTIALAIGVRRMAARGALIRRLAAVETLGSVTVICSDKTGTITRNELTVTTVWLPDGRLLEATGVGYAPEGEVRGADRGDPALEALVVAGALCNDATLAPPEAEHADWRVLGDPVDGAFLTLARKTGLDPEEARRRFPRHGELPFDPATKMMATRHDGRAFVKGAPEVVLTLCAPPAREPDVESLASRGLRLIALAEAPDGPLEPDALRGRARLLGLAGLIDPPRPEAREAVARCMEAGIRPMLVTGHQPATARAVAAEVGITDADAVFARVVPERKLRIVEELQDRGEVVAMTGDGVNDAPALSQADVGVAMGRAGTEVAKEAAAMVLTDDHFATIVRAIEEGRTVFRNLQKALLLLLSTAGAEVALLFASLLLGFPLPLLAVQILWNNVVTEGVITVNLAMEPGEGDEMQRPPVRRDAPLLPRALLGRIAFLAAVLAAVTLGWFVWSLGRGAPIAETRTEIFALLAVCEWFNVLNCRAELRSAFRLSLLRNRWLLGGLLVGVALQTAVVFLPPLQGIFHTVPLEPVRVLLIGAAGSLVLWAEEARKLLIRRRATRGGRRPGASGGGDRPPDRRS